MFTGDSGQPMKRFFISTFRAHNYFVRAQGTPHYLSYYFYDGNKLYGVEMWNQKQLVLVIDGKY